MEKDKREIILLPRIDILEEATTMLYEKLLQKMLNKKLLVFKKKLWESQSNYEKRRKVCVHLFFATKRKTKG